MSPIRGDELVDAAARAAESLYQMGMTIVENYHEPQNELTLTRAEVDREIQERGHIPPEPGCSSDTCAKARLMFDNALAQA